MLYHVSRGGQNYGPYTLEDLQRYVASGNVLPTDLARSDDRSDWVPVAQILGTTALTASTAVAPPYPDGYPAAAAAAYAPTTAPYPDPPNLHWALVLLIGIFTCGLFSVVWCFVQAAWMRRVNPRSNALFLYIAYAVISYGGAVVRVYLMALTAFRNPYWGIGAPVSLIAFVLVELAFFDMRRCMEEHFNGPEPIGLTLSGVMTFFFGIFYFQYHFTRINEMKRMARYRGAAI